MCVENVYISSARDVPLDVASRFCIVKIDESHNNVIFALVCIVCCLAVDSKSYLWCVSCDEVIGNKQMAHSQTLAVIVFSLIF